MNQTTKVVLIIAGVLLLLMIVPSLIWGGASGGYGGGMMGPGMMGGFGLLGWFGPILMVLFWVLVIWGIIALVRGTNWTGPSDSSSSRSDSALEILRKRYSRGEINKEEYEEKKKDLV
ncbi:MAG: SHOCT domain-containing protein [Dehalococcoidia bacterium]|nr:SHOCT domain-containing protein [Dehalococcoidia bacterium]